MIEIDFTKELARAGKFELAHGYELDGNNEYVIKETKDYFMSNCNTLMTIEVMGGIDNPDCYNVVKDFNKNAHTLCKSGKKEELSRFYGKGPVWKNEYTQGIIVKLIDDDITTYEILVECSRNCTGFKYSKFIPSDGECYDAVRHMLGAF